jgi:acyl-CoA thioester hydrolase
MSARETLSREHALVIEIPVAWGEMDAMGHVNNTVYFRYFETARIAYFERVGFLTEMERSGVGPILASTRCRFRIPLTYPDRIWVGTRASELEEDRFLMQYRIVSDSKDALAAEGDGLIVSYDYRESRKAPIPKAVRAAIESLEGSS